VAHHRLTYHGGYCFLDIPFWPTLVSEKVLVRFLPYRPYDHSWGEGPTKVHLFLAVVVFSPELDCCRNVTMDLVGLAENTYFPVPQFCSVGVAIEDMVGSFFLSLTKMTSSWTGETSFP
jgi:hypothetical protein